MRAEKSSGGIFLEGGDKNVSPPEQDDNPLKCIESSSKLLKITFTLITLLDKRSVDQSGDSCAKQRIFDVFCGGSCTNRRARPSFGKVYAFRFRERVTTLCISKKRLCPW